jgi:predicted nucleotidyltransferase component of viral defense system
MLNLRSEDAIHKSYLNRVLIEIIDQPFLAHHLAFKGGSCAAMLGYLDRFSIDLDFDLLRDPDEMAVRHALHQVFETLGLTVAEEFENALMFRLRYPSEPGKRNNLKVSVNSIVVKANQYQVQYLPEIDRMMTCQTVETMFANKLVAVTDRFNLYGTIAGRDIYDLHHFYLKGYAYHAPIIRERTGLAPDDYLRELLAFIKTHVTHRIINEDLNTLLPPKQFQGIRKVLIPETLAFLTSALSKTG